GQGQDHGAILDACARYLDDPSVELSDKERDWLLQQKLSALIADGQATEALTILDASPDSVVFNEQRVLVLIELGRNKEAADYLTKWRHEAGGTAQIIRLQVRVERELGHIAPMNEYLAELRRLNP